MITREENERLAQVGPGTPGGELLRRYWYPVATLDDLTAESPTRFVQLLGEDLVLFKDKSGRVGLVADHCSHRGASLLYGRVEERGIACAYHGWLYDTAGNCLQCPAEPAGSLFHLTVKHRAYPVEPMGGLYWAYLGPSPAPVLPRYDMLELGRIVHIQEFTLYNANWIQMVENNLDGAHVYVLHQDTLGPNQNVANTTRGLLDQLKAFDYWEYPFGIMRHQELADGYVEDDPLIFPNMLRRMNQMVINIPMDDTHCYKYDVFVEDKDLPPHPSLSPDGERGRVRGHTNGAGDRPIEHYVLTNEDTKLPPDQLHPYPRHRMDRLRLQDYMVVETQGPISARENWRLGTSDRGIALFWSVLTREAEKVQRGEDPMGVIRDPAQAYVDTKFDVVRDLAGRAAYPDGVLVYPKR